MIWREDKNIQHILSKKNVSDALRLCPGKELLNRLAPQAGCRNSTDLARAVRKNCKPAEFKDTAELQLVLKKFFQ